MNQSYRVMIVSGELDPVFEHLRGPICPCQPDRAPGWYFWDAEWNAYYGPCANEQEARAEREYMEQMRESEKEPQRWRI
jgi:hypothetical protein